MSEGLLTSKYAGKIEGDTAHHTSVYHLAEHMYAREGAQLPSRIDNRGAKRTLIARIAFANRDELLKLYMEDYPYE